MAVDILISVAAKVAEYLVEPTIRQAQYLFCVNKVTKNLDNEKMQLKSKRDDILSLVEQAEKRTEIIEDAVRKWLNDVKNLLEEVEKLEQEMKENVPSCQGWCPTWRRYSLCKDLAGKTKIIMDFVNNKSSFDTFSHRAPLPGIEYISSEEFTYFESTKMAYNQLMKALNDGDAYMIGLYGMGGSGKTTLVTEVGKEASKSKLFDLVILVTVSQTPNVISIQDQMAELLGLELKERSEDGRAKRLWLKLKVEKRVLIILDDVWAKFNMESIGVRPDDNNKLNFKVILTTRRREVCASMGCEREILLHLLSEREASNLFQMHAGIGDWSSSNLLEVARDVCNECNGLPIAVKAVGSSLKGKGEDEWKVALQSLRHSEPFDDHEEEGVRHAFTCLKLSYDYLRNKEAEMLLLMCSMFPEDHQILIEDLITYGVGLGVCGNCNSIGLARSQVRVGINKLVDSCLLSHSGKRVVKMHDMVRDVTLWIASQSEDKKVLVNVAKDFNSLTEEEGAIKDYFGASSWYKKTNITNCRLDAPKLEILLLKTMNTSSLDFMLASSEGVKRLRVLAIVNDDDEYCGYLYSNIPSLSLPESTQWLANLRTLHLRNWKLGDMSFLVCLTRLEFLILEGCCIKSLPKGMEKLSKLKLLHLSRCNCSKDFDYEAMGRCSQLEELYFYGNSYLSESEGRIKDILVLALPNLQRFLIQLKRFKRVNNEGSIRVLHLANFSTSSLSASKHNLLQRAYEILLERLHGGCKNIIPDMVRAVGGMNELTNLWFRNCSEIECLVDTTHHQSSFQVDALLPKLVKLDLLDMDNLVQLCRGPPLLALGFFKKLQELSIYRCMQLQSIFPEACNLCNLKTLNIGINSSSREYTSEYYKCPLFATLFSVSVSRSLQQLEELCVQGCQRLERIVSYGGEDSVEDSSRSMFPNLKKLYIWNCPMLEFILPISFVQQGLSQLQEIKIYHVDGLKYVFGQYGHEAHSSQQNQIQVVLPSLKIFKLNCHRNLLGICPEGFHLMCPSLEELVWKECPKLHTTCINSTIGLEQVQQHLDKERQVFCSNTETSNELCKERLSTAASQLQVFRKKSCRAEGMFQLQVEGEPSNSNEWKPLNSNLHYLQLHDLLELRFIWNNLSKFISISNLNDVSIADCPKLKAIFSPCIVRYLPMLETLYIWNCEELEEIMSSDPEDTQQQVCFPRLENICVTRCKKLKCLFYDSMAGHFPQLRSLAITECHQLKQVLGLENSPRDGVGEAEERILFPKLKKLVLQRLPIFCEISPLFDVQQRMHVYLVTDCPQYNSSYRVKGQNPLPSIAMLDNSASNWLPK